MEARKLESFVGMYANLILSMVTEGGIAWFFAIMATLFLIRYIYLGIKSNIKWKQEQ